jgi:HAD superfamily hydrolase (TIGR01509 family)
VHGCVKQEDPTLGLIFDFDGVVVLSEPVHLRAWRDLASHFDQELPPRFEESGVGRSDVVLCEELSKIWSGELKSATLLEAKQRFYLGRVEKEGQLVPGVKKALAYLSKRFPLSLATSSGARDLEPYFERHGIEAYFRSVLTIESVTRPKPDPEIYLKAAASLGLVPERCLIFEDSPPGADAARAAGARVIGMTTSFRAEELGPLETSMADFCALESMVALLTRYV